MVVFLASALIIMNYAKSRQGTSDNRKCDNLQHQFSVWSFWPEPVPKTHGVDVTPRGKSEPQEYNDKSTKQDGAKGNLELACNAYAAEQNRHGDSHYRWNGEEDDFLHKEAHTRQEIPPKS